MGQSDFASISMSRINTGPYHNQKQVKLAIHVHYTVSNKESSYAITQELATQVPRAFEVAGHFVLQRNSAFTSAISIVPVVHDILN